MRSFFGWLLMASVGFLGCGNNPNPPSPPGPPATPVSDVKGTIIDTHVIESGDITSFRGAMQFEIAALVPNEDGSFREILANIDKDGAFVIPSVPEVPYHLRFIELIGASALPPRYVMNAPRQIDFGRVYVGRPDATEITVEPTELDLTATGLVPWADGSFLEMFSLGSGAAGELLPTQGVFPMEMATDLNGYHVDTAQLLHATLVEGEKGDKAFITQLSGIADLTAPYRSVRRVFEPSSFTQADGVKTSLSGMFVDASPKARKFGIDAAAFNAFSDAVNPNATAAGKNVRVIAEPGGERATASLTPNLMICEALPSATLPSSFSYGNPFPSGWTEIVTTDFAFSMTHTAPTGIPKTTVVNIGQSGPVDSWEAPSVPQLSPVVDIQVNGMPAYDTLSGIGFTPTLTFSPPSVGTPAVYIIAVRRLDPGGATTRTTAIFSTTEPTLQIPAGTLDFGYYYYFRITVRAQFDVNQPFKSGTTNAFASSLTGVLTP
jgi:hypothetical protein